MVKKIKVRGFNKILLFLSFIFLALTLAAAVYISQNSTNLKAKANISTSLSSFVLVTKGDLNLYTADANEKSQAISNHGFNDSSLVIGKLFIVPYPNTRPLYRFKTESGYFYTGSEEEAISVTKSGWVKEGIAGYVYTISETGSIPLYRFRKNGLWGLGTDKDGLQKFIDNGYTKDGVVGYIYPPEYIPGNSTKTQIGAFLFYWYDCPGTNYHCDKTKMPYVPINYESYSAKKLDWFKTQFSEMSKAGIDIIIAVSWGSRHPSLPTLVDSQSVPLMVQALRENKSTQKLALLDDTNSIVAEWNLDQNGVYSNPTENSAIPKMPLSNDKNWAYFYDRKIKPFYQMVPKELWATHNGQSLNKGGKPIILIYDAARSFSNLEYSDEMWTAIKNAFKKDFQVEPFIILDYSWFDFNPQKSQLEKVANGKFVWAGANDSVSKKHTLNGYTTASVDPGFECPTWNIYINCQSKSRHIDPFSGHEGDGERLKGTFKNAVGSNLILVETWNELGEGSGIFPSSQYKNKRGEALKPNYYLELLSSLKRSYIKD